MRRFGKRDFEVQLTTPGLSASITSHSDVFAAAGAEKPVLFATVRTAWAMLSFSIDQQPAMRG